MTFSSRRDCQDSQPSLEQQVAVRSQIPGYVQKLWEDFVSGRYDKKVKDYSRLFGMEFDPSRPPFIFAGNLEDRGTKMLTFGLAPYSRKEVSQDKRNSECPPEDLDLDDYYLWRLNYFNTIKIPHRLHCYYARLCWGILGIKPPSNEVDSQWLHRNGYLTFDLIPYYARHWQSPNWSNDEILKDVQQHFFECIDLVQEDEIGFAVFSGKAWEELLVTNDISKRVSDFDKNYSFTLSEVTGKAHHRFATYVGKLRIRNRHIPAVIIGSLIHQIRGLSYDEILAVGHLIGQRFP